MSDAPARNTTGPFVAVIFILILLPFSFGVYSLYNSFNERHLQRERNRIGLTATAQALPARPVLWEAWTEPTGKSTSCDDASGSWNNIQPLWAKPELAMLISNNVTSTDAGLESAAASGRRAIGEAGRQLHSRTSSLWWSLGLLASFRSSRNSPSTEPQPHKLNVNALEEDGNIWKQGGDYRLQIGVVVALPSVPVERPFGGEAPGGRKGDDMGEQVDSSTIYCIGTASYPIRVDAG